MTRRTFLVVFVFLFSLLQAQIADSAGSEVRAAELFVLIPGLETSGSAPVRQLLDESFIFRGSKVRLGIRANERGEISLSYRNPSGQIQSLLRSAKLAADEWLSVPSGDKWFTIDGEPGSYTFILAFSDGRQVTRSLNVLTPSSPPAELPTIGSKPTQAETFEISLLLPVEGDQELLDAKDVLARADSVTTPRNISLRGAAAELYKRIAPGVVLVVAGDSYGSGSIISADGQIITNWHVVNNGSSTGIYFKPPGQREIMAANRSEADVIKVDEVADLALLKPRKFPRGYPHLAFADMSDVEIAMDVHAIGHPLGEFWTYTRGTVSQVRKNYQWTEEETKKTYSAEVIQTQTPINPGNSGGPLFSDAGKIIGINSFSAPEAQGINFAVSVGEVKRFLKSDGGKIPLKPRRKPVNISKFPQKTYDRDKDGGTDAVAFDKNDNGFFEITVVDENQDGKADYVLWDRDENGKVDIKIILGDAENIWLFDTDEDGQFDALGVDSDKDGRIDRYQRLSSS